MTGSALTVKHKNHKKVVNEVISKKLGNYNSLFRRLIDFDEAYSDELESKCRLNKDGTTLCKEVLSYVNSVVKFNELGCLMDEVKDVDKLNKNDKSKIISKDQTNRPL